MTTERIDIVDSHTAGEPTRVVVAGGPDLGDGDLAQRRGKFAAELEAVEAAWMEALEAIETAAA